MNDGERALSPSSRIFFGIHHPIQHNVKVKDLGYVHPDWMPAFLGYWSMENNGETQQAPEVTEQAVEDEYEEQQGNEEADEDDDDEEEEEEDEEQDEEDDENDKAIVR